LPLILANVVAAGVLLACGNFEADTAKPTTGPTQKETAQAFFERFPSREYESFAEAEEAAGFHIPRPAAEFPNLHGNTTFLQWLPSVSAPVSESYYAPSPESVQSQLGNPYKSNILVRVAVSGLFRDGDATMMQGTEVRFGSKLGWLTESVGNYGLLFNYACGNLNAETLWCTVEERNGIDRGTIERFVESLQ
jgi:hypothetical protein